MKNNLMIASSSRDKVASWQSGLNGFAYTAFEVNSMDKLRNEVVQIRPKVTLVDYDLLRSSDVAGLGRISSETKVIVIGSDISEEMEWQLLKAGVRGCCRSDVDPKFLCQVVTAVHDGELWIRRTLTCRLIDELGRATARNKSYRDSLGQLSKLTQREYDIAVRVGNGESNKLIANACGITERTVKAHLTEVFQKLGVTDRLNLALVLSAEVRVNEPARSVSPLMGKLEINRPQMATYPSP
jgi:DNA-binding NarL/FixJ family response regulator